MANNNKKAAAGRNPMNLGNALNLERVPSLAPKFANKLGKDAITFAVVYSGAGTRVIIDCVLDANGRPRSPRDGRPQTESVDLVEFERRVALKNQPTEADRLSALRRKFELRLNMEFPREAPASGSEADIQAWLGNRPFAERRALLMSQKDFDKSYPNAFRAQQ